MSKPRPLTKLMPKATAKILGKKGMLFAKLVDKWPEIVGVDMAQKTTPLDLKFSKTASKKQSNKATLHLAIPGAYAPEIQAQIPQLTERLNSFFGYNAIEMIKLVHTNGKAVEAKFKRQDKPPCPPQIRQKVTQDTENVQSPELKDALKALGEAIITRQTTK